MANIFDTIVISILLSGLLTLVVYAWFRRHGGVAGDKQYNDRLVASTFVIGFVVGMFVVPCIPREIGCLFSCGKY